MLGIVAGALLPATALGTTASYSPSGGLLIEGDAAGETLRVQVLDESFRVIRDDGPAVVAGSGCVQVSASATIVQCLVSVQGPLSRSVTARLGDGADDLSFIINPGAAPVPATIDGGDDDDTLTSGLRAGPNGAGAGEPPLAAVNAAAHTIIGGEGDDLFLGDSGGTDVLVGGPGDDTLRARASARSTDTFVGGAGTDVADYSARLDAVRLTTSNTATLPDDGAPGEGDDIGRAETLIGGAGPDTLEIRSGPVFTTSQSPPTTPSMRGNGGADTLTALGDPAAVSMDGGAGRDVIRGGSGPDAISARDGERDKITCGAGADRLTADLKDLPVPSDCESVNKSDRREGPNVVVLTRIARVAETGRVGRPARVSPRPPGAVQRDPPRASRARGRPPGRGNAIYGRTRELGADRRRAAPRPGGGLAASRRPRAAALDRARPARRQDHPARAGGPAGLASCRCEAASGEAPPRIATRSARCGRRSGSPRCGCPPRACGRCSRGGTSPSAR